MRLWTLHPKYLDSRGLCALWREALLAQAVLRGSTKGYRNHPQLIRFREQPDSEAAISCYLLGVHAESVAREYDFDVSKIAGCDVSISITETEGQLLWEWDHLRAKLRVRAPEVYASFANLQAPEPHPMFRIVPGPLRSWESAAGLPN
jgi:hypothetical protein